MDIWTRSWTAHPSLELRLFMCMWSRGGVGLVELEDAGVFSVGRV